MKTDPNAELPEVAGRSKSLAKALGQSEHVKELVKESAEELSSVNTVLKEELADHAAMPQVERALEKSEAVESKVQEASEKLTVVNRALEGEVRERNVVERQLAAAIEQKEAACEAALHDVLTGLPNRTLFNDRLEHALVQAKRHGWSLAVMFIDLDKFKNINDTHGHHAGDAVLRTTAQRLTENARGGDTVSRHGGDEFLYLLTEVSDEKDIARIAEKIVQALRAPCKVSVGGLDIDASIGASIGISIFPQHGATADALVKSADTAMYRAKQGKSGYAFAP